MFNKLSFRLALPVIAGVLVMWGFLSFIVLGSISRFAAERSERELKSYAREMADIMGDAYDHLLLSGRSSDPAEVRVARGRALARLEKHLRLTENPAVVAGPNGEILLNHGVADPAGLMAMPLKPDTAAVVEVDGVTRHAYRFESTLWGWKVIVAEAAGSYAGLARDVRTLYLEAGGVLVLALALFLYLSHRVVSRPAKLIARALEKNERPAYRGIEEFESLSRSIASMMDSLDERERLVRVGRTWYRQMFESAPVMMFTLAPSGWFSDVNRSLCDHSGYSREKLVSGPASDILAVDRERLDALWMGMPLRQVPAVLRTSSGKKRQVVLDALLTEDPSGQRVVLAVVTDLTDRMKTERALIAAKEAAEEASLAKSEFLANVSHEIRTPLNGVLGMLQLLEKSALDGRQQGWVKNALDCGRSLLTLLGDILDFSSLEAGGQQCSLEPFAPGDILVEIAKLYERQAQAKNLSLAVETDASLPRTMMGDGGRLRQVLFNLVGNAVKFTAQGSVTLRVEAVGRDRLGVSRLLFTVEDTGIGIDPGKLKAVFQPFTQADGSHTRRYQGAGLGLAIVKRLVELWGGTLEIDTEPGTGTAIHFTMPVHSAPFGTEAPLPAPAYPAAQAAGRRVLLAEDDPINTVMTMDMLESLGYRATIVENGEEALKALAQEDFDCLIMDIQMPEMDGITATRAIRTQSAFGDKTRIPIVALTAHALPGDRERFLAAGMDDYLAKPVEYEDLAGVLARAMGKPWRHRLS
ncbi:MAG: ATP-binding protein [Thermodesulfobacteriota bacterium]